MEGPPEALTPSSPEQHKFEKAQAKCYIIFEAAGAKHIGEACEAN